MLSWSRSGAEGRHAPLGEACLGGGPRAGILKQQQGRKGGDDLWLAQTCSSTSCRAERNGDKQRFRVLVEAIIAEERAKQHHLLADRLHEIITVTGSADLLHRDAAAQRVADLVHDVIPRRRLEQIHLAEAVRAALTDVIEEHHRADLLRSHNLEPRNRILLEGPPGNGKTSVAEAIAAETMLPFYVVRYEGIVSSFLGETTARLANLFDFVRTRRCVVFFDEFDAVGKERSDNHETGEIKRVVSALLLQVDRLPSHVIAVTATNHARAARSRCMAPLPGATRRSVRRPERRPRSSFCRSSRVLEAASAWRRVRWLIV